MEARQSKIRAGRARRRKSERGVSPIIATILLVAITVVLAAVLYVLVSGLTRTGANVPYQLEMTPSSSGGSTPNYYDIIALEPTSGLTTSAFGLKVTTPSSVSFASQAPAGCATITSGIVLPSSCTGPATTGYFAALVAPATGYIVALWSGTSPGWTYASGSTVALNNGYTLWVFSGSTQVAGASYQLSAYSTGASSVSGSTFL
jgi:flagellin-like protein